jgi:hypothetical protein
MYFISTRLSADPNTEEGQKTYANFITAVTSLGPWSNRLDNTWLVESKLPAGRIRTLLKPHMQPGDRIFVGQFTTNWAGFNMGQNFPEWAKRREFGTPGQPS